MNRHTAMLDPVAVLFPEQPLVHLRREKGIGRNEVAVARQIADDGIGLCERPTAVESEHGHLPCTVQLEELRRVRFAFQRVVGDPFIRKAEPVADLLHFQAVARIDIAMDFHDHLPHFDSGRATVSMRSVNRPARSDETMRDQNL
jgi:hypothetical protein